MTTTPFVPLAPRRAKPVRLIDLPFPRTTQRPTRSAKALISEVGDDGLVEWTCLMCESASGLCESMSAAAAAWAAHRVAAHGDVIA